MGITVLHKIFPFVLGGLLMIAFISAFLSGWDRTVEGSVKSTRPENGCSQLSVNPPLWGCYISGWTVSYITTKEFRLATPK
jgi:hypothetical protein